MQMRSRELPQTSQTEGLERSLWRMSFNPFGNRERATCLRFHVDARMRPTESLIRFEAQRLCEVKRVIHLPVGRSVRPPVQDPRLVFELLVWHRVAHEFRPDAQLHPWWS